MVSASRIVIFIYAPAVTSFIAALRAGEGKVTAVTQAVWRGHSCPHSACDISDFGVLILLCANDTPQTTLLNQRRVPIPILFFWRDHDGGGDAVSRF